MSTEILSSKNGGQSMWLQKEEFFFRIFTLCGSVREIFIAVFAFWIQFFHCHPNTHTHAKMKCEMRGRVHLEATVQAQNLPESSPLWCLLLPVSSLVDRLEGLPTPPSSVRKHMSPHFKSRWCVLWWSLEESPALQLHPQEMTH